MSEGRRFCENCGTEIGPTTNFCPNCGAAQTPNPDVPSGPPPIPETGRIQTASVPGVAPPPLQAGGRSWGKILAIGCGGLVVLFVLFVGCAALLGSGGGGKADLSGPGEGRTFTSESYAELATDPDSFRGASVDVEGRVFRNPEVRGDETSFQMFADPENSEWNTIIHTDNPPSGLASGDTVRVQGNVQGAFEGENAFGASLKATEVRANSVEITETEAQRKANRRSA